MSSSSSQTVSLSSEPDPSFDRLSRPITTDNDYKLYDGEVGVTSSDEEEDEESKEKGDIRLSPVKHTLNESKPEIIVEKSKSKLEKLLA